MTGLRTPRLPRRLRPGLRRRLVLGLAGGGLLLSSFLAAGTYLLSHRYLVDQRERTVTRTALADAAVVRDGLRTTGRPVSEILGALAPDPNGVVLLHYRGSWYSSSLTHSEQDVPQRFIEAVEAGGTVHGWGRLDGRGAVVVGVPLVSVNAEFFEIRRADELRETLDTLRGVLAGLALFTAGAGALVGRAVAGRVTRPLNEVAAAAGRIAAGDLRTRLTATEDPDLVAIVGSFNAMVDALDERMARDARFAADVSHELRTPLTALVTSVDVLRGRSTDLSADNLALLDVIAAQLKRFRNLLEDLIELARVDAGGAGSADRRPVDLVEIVRYSLSETGRTTSAPAADGPVMVDAEPRLLRRALVNLFDNADAHGGGLVSVSVRRDGTDAFVCVDDAGPGVPQADRDRVFARFARLDRHGPTPGSGLGLSLVAEIVRWHDGDVWCAAAPGGGARFTIRLRTAQVRRLEPSGR